MNKQLVDIKTNIITGFLGVGKTSAILHLMTQKPADERWSVLVNEFGDIGIDGAVYQSKGIAIKEIPGGCMCCSTGIPLEIAINQLLKLTQPDRLLIEPSGLGHPQRILNTLRGEHFQEVLDIRASFCLIDPRNLSNERYTTNENFIDQIALADVLVANKIDLCNTNVIKQFDHYVASLQPNKQKILKTQQGKINSQWLDIESNLERKSHYPNHHQQASSPKNGDAVYKSTSASFPKQCVFNINKVQLILGQLDAERIKSVINTNEGYILFNEHNQQTQLSKITGLHDSRIEIISHYASSAHTMTTETLTKKLTHALIPPIYALDFDGVICDSAIETSITGWKCAQTLWSDMASSHITDELIQQFRSIRPMLETGYEAILIMRLLHNSVSNNELCKNYHQHMASLIESDRLDVTQLITLFGKTRDQWIQDNEEEWLSKNPLFKGIQEKLQTLEGHTWYIVTTKQERFVKRILAGSGISLSDDHIFGMDKKLDKQAVLQQIIELHPEHSIIFVEDRLPTLLNIIKNQLLNNLALQLVDWGYNTVADRKKIQDKPIELINLQSFLSRHYITQTSLNNIK